MKKIMNRGIKHHRAKWSYEVVTEVRRLYSEGMKPKVIAWKTGVSIDRVRDFLYRKERQYE